MRHGSLCLSPSIVCCVLAQSRTRTRISMETSRSPACSTKPPHCSRSTPPTPSASAPTAAPPKQWSSRPFARHPRPPIPDACSRFPASARAWSPTSRRSSARHHAAARELLHALQAHHARAPSPPRHGPQDRRSRLSALPGLRHRHARSRSQSRPPRHSAAHGRQVHRQAPQGHRGLPQELQRASASTSRAIPRRRHQPLSSATFPASKASPPPARSAAAARRSAISTCSSPARPAKPTSSPPPSSTSPPFRSSTSSSRGPEQSQFHLAQQSTDRRPSPPARQLRRGARNTSPAPRCTTSRCASAPSSAASRSASTRSSASMTTHIAAATEEDIYHALDLDCIPPELRENCGEIEAAAAHDPAAPHHAGRHPRRCPHAHRRDRRHATPSARWPKPPSPAASSTSPSPTTRRISP